MKILFLSARFPQLPFKGDQGRAYNQIRLLSKRHKITLVSLTDIKITKDSMDHIGQFCDRVIPIYHPKYKKLINLITAPFIKYPLQTILRLSLDFWKAVHYEINFGSYDIAHVQMVRMAPYLEHINNIPKLLDLIDALSLNMERRYIIEHSFIKPAVYIEWKRLQRYEKMLCNKYDQIIVVSSIDKAAIGLRENIRINPNGVTIKEIFINREERNPAKVIFLGTMDYFPNIDAVCYFVYEILPLIKKHIPEIKLDIFGPNPTRAVRRLSLDPCVKVRGFVPDLTDYLKKATIAISPMRSCSGIQTKVLEAMASGIPVVVTPLALGDIKAIPEEHLLVADNPTEFAGQVVRLIKDEALWKRIAQNAWKLMLENYSWEESVSNLEKYYEIAIKHHQNKKNKILSNSK